MNDEMNYQSYDEYKNQEIDNFKEAYNNLSAFRRFLLMPRRLGSKLETIPSNDNLDGILKAANTAYFLIMSRLSNLFSSKPLPSLAQLYTQEYSIMIGASNSRFSGAVSSKDERINKIYAALNTAYEEKFLIGKPDKDIFNIIVKCKNPKIFISNLKKIIDITQSNNERLSGDIFKLVINFKDPETFISNLKNLINVTALKDDVKLEDLSLLNWYLNEENIIYESIIEIIYESRIEKEKLPNIKSILAHMLDSLIAHKEPEVVVSALNSACIFHLLTGSNGEQNFSNILKHADPSRCVSELIESEKRESEKSSASSNAVDSVTIVENPELPKKRVRFFDPNAKKTLNAPDQTLEQEPKDPGSRPSL